MLQRHWVGAQLAALALSLAGPALADGMRCGNRLVTTGDSTYVVRARCGDPQDARRHIVTRTERRRVSVPCARPGGRCERVQEVAVDVVVDEWTYDFGPQRFVHYLTFFDGKLAQVETGSYGTER